MTSFGIILILFKIISRFYQPKFDFYRWFPIDFSGLMFMLQQLEAGYRLNLQPFSKSGFFWDENQLFSEIRVTSFGMKTTSFGMGNDFFRAVERLLSGGEMASFGMKNDFFRDENSGLNNQKQKSCIFKRIRVYRL